MTQWTDRIHGENTRNKSKKDRKNHKEKTVDEKTNNKKNNQIKQSAKHTDILVS